jgi:hypothetical protein
MLSFLKSSLQTRGLAILIPALGIIVITVTLYLKHLNQTITELNEIIADKEVKLRLEKINTQNAFLMLDKQNAKVRALEINNEKLQKTADSLDLALKKRLSTIQTPSNTDKCETKLNFYETVLKEFNDEK